MCVGVCIIEGSVACWERGWGGECGVLCTEMLDGRTAFVVFWRIGNVHVGKNDMDVFLLKVGVNNRRQGRQGSDFGGGNSLPFLRRFEQWKAWSGVDET